MKLSELEAQGLLFGNKVKFRAWSSGYIIFEHKLTNGDYVGVNSNGQHHVTCDNSGWHLVEEKLPEIEKLELAFDVDTLCDAGEAIVDVEHKLNELVERVNELSKKAGL